MTLESSRRAGDADDRAAAAAATRTSRTAWWWHGSSSGTLLFHAQLHLSCSGSMCNGAGTRNARIGAKAVHSAQIFIAARMIIVLRKITPI
jgi:hypothetical protein